MRLYDISDLEEAMNLIKEEIVKDLSESVSNETNNPELSIEALEIS